MFLEILQVLVNNLLFLFLWKLFFNGFSWIDGWSFEEMRLLIAFGTGALGLMQIFFGGVQKIPALVLSCQRGGALLHKKKLLLSLLCGSSSYKGWGHCITSLCLLVFQSPSSLPLCFLYIVCSSLILTGILTSLYSLLFWFPLQKFLQLYEELLLLFSLYPTHIYRKGINILLLSIFPAGYVGSFPTKLFFSFSWNHLGALLLALIFFVLLASILFSCGCRKHQHSSSDQMIV